MPLFDMCAMQKAMSPAMQTTHVQFASLMCVKRAPNDSYTRVHASQKHWSAIVKYLETKGKATMAATPTFG